MGDWGAGLGCWLVCIGVFIIKFRKLYINMCFESIYIYNKMFKNKFLGIVSFCFV